MHAIISSNQQKAVSSLQIDLFQSVIALSGTEHLKAYQFAQLGYYGFLKQGDNLCKDSETPVHEIVKLTAYLDGEQIGYALSDALTGMVYQLREKRQALSEVFAHVKAIKHDGFLDETFKDFRKFTATLPRKLKPHQLKSAYHFYMLKNGANFSVPGSGKTSTVLAVYEKYKREGKCNMLFLSLIHI